MCINSVLLFIETFSTEAVCFSALKGKLEETNKQYFKFSTTLFTGMSTLKSIFCDNWETVLIYTYRFYHNFFYIINFITCIYKHVRMCFQLKVEFKKELDLP